MTTYPQALKVSSCCPPLSASQPATDSSESLWIGLHLLELCINRVAQCAFIFVWLLELSTILRGIHVSVLTKHLFLFLLSSHPLSDHTTVYPFTINQRGKHPSWQLQIKLPGSGQVCACGPVFSCLSGKHLGGGMAVSGGSCISF